MGTEGRIKTFGDFQVEAYKETPLQLTVVKNVVPEEKPEEPEQKPEEKPEEKPGRKTGTEARKDARRKSRTEPGRAARGKTRSRNQTVLRIITRIM